MNESMYTEVKGCNTYVNGEAGVTVGFLYEQQFRAGAFVKLMDRAAMLYVELGKTVGDRKDRQEIVSVREIGRDEFDRLNGISALRRELGWDLAA